MRPHFLSIFALSLFFFSRSIGTEPNEVNFSNAGEIFDRLYGKYYSDLNAKIINPHFELDQKVRLVLPKNTFKKGNCDLSAPRASLTRPSSFRLQTDVQSSRLHYCQGLQNFSAEILRQRRRGRHYRQSAFSSFLSLFFFQSLSPFRNLL